MATAAAAALLDELMGRTRNVGPHEAVSETKWHDEDVCKYFLVKFCPNELFVNTKADLGPCSRIHDEELRKIFEKERSSRPSLANSYEDEFVRFAQDMIADVEKKIRKGKERLALAQSKSSEVDKRLMTSNSGDVRSKEERLIVLREKIEALCNQAEEAGTRGDVEEAQRLTQMCEDYKEQKEALLRTSLESSGTSPWIQAAELTPQEKLMEVCEICGSFLIVGDAQSRIDDHLLGKQHMGYARLRVAVEEIHSQRKKEKEEREKARERDREERRKRMEERDRKDRPSGRRDADRDVGRTRSRDRDRDRVHDKDGRGRCRDDRTKDRSRSPSRRKSEDNVHHRDSKSRDRERDKDKDRRRDKDRSRDAGRDRDRDREKDRHRDRDRHRERDREENRVEKSKSRDRERIEKSKSRDRERRGNDQLENDDAGRSTNGRESGEEAH